jgi:uncharacterized membrane protein (UPF0127 family)
MFGWLYCPPRKKALIVSGLLVVVLLVTLSIADKNFIFGKKHKIGEVRIRGQIIKVEIVDKAPLLFEGLSSRDNLAENSGMLFIFPKDDVYDFWMKEMKFSLDIIWIKDNKIVEVWQNAPLLQEKEIPRYHPQNLARYVLEVNAGTYAKYGWQIGDKVDIITR